MNKPCWKRNEFDGKMKGKVINAGGKKIYVIYIRLNYK